MKAVIAEEAAREEIALWADHFEVDLAELEIKELLPTVMRGRVVFDEENDEFEIKLKSVIELENGKTVTSIKLYHFYFHKLIEIHS